MSVLLIDPPLEPVEYQMKLYGRSLGLGYIAAMALQQGLPTRILELTEPDYGPGSPLLRELESFRPEVVGITTVLFKYNEALRVAAAVRSACPDALIVLGGPYVTNVPDDALRHQAVDVVVRGEGELTFAELLAHRREPEAWSQIAGISYRTPGGEVVHNEARPGLRDLSSLPSPARHLYPRIEEDQVHFVITSRGCPFTCTYCQSPQFWGRSIRFRNVDDVVGEVRHVLEHYRVRHIVFPDDVFTANKRRTLELMDAFAAIRRERPFRWTCQTRVDCFDEEVSAALVRGGCETVVFGIESADEAVRDRIRKGVRTEQIIRAVRAARSHGLQVEMGFIVGLPGDTEQTPDLIHELVETAQPSYVTVFPLALFPGTPIFAQAGVDFQPDREFAMRLRREVIRRVYPKYMPRYMKWQEHGQGSAAAGE